MSGRGAGGLLRGWTKGIGELRGNGRVWWLEGRAEGGEEGPEASDECEGRGTDGLLLEEGKLPPTGCGVRAERKEVSVFTLRGKIFKQKTIWVFGCLWGVRCVERFSPGMT